MAHANIINPTPPNHVHAPAGCEVSGRERGERGEQRVGCGSLLAIARLVRLGHLDFLQLRADDHGFVSGNLRFERRRGHASLRTALGAHGAGAGAAAAMRATSASGTTTASEACRPIARARTCASALTSAGGPDIVSVGEASTYGGGGQTVAHHSGTGAFKVACTPNQPEHQRRAHARAPTCSGSRASNTIAVGYRLGDVQNLAPV